MPELPEVQAVVDSLNHNKIPGKIIRTINSPNGYEPVCHGHSLFNFQKFLENKLINCIKRRGKFIIMELNDGYLLFHLRMTGKFLYELSNDDQKHISLKIIFKDNSSLYFKDVRKFGKAYISTNLQWLENKLGIEPLSKKFNAQWLIKTFKSYNKMVKPLLLDQKVIAGLGNIYIDEALWDSKIHPKSICSKITNHKIILLCSSIKSILKSALKHKGTTIIDFQYGNNNKGQFEKKLQVFGKENKPCPRCNQKIIKIFVGQRGTHYCNKCQIFYKIQP
ncbi:MAG: DNA-formamidopyrimidine glycosylase [Candidatus Neomarinimicrobiota bacterium]|nr:DNA-formamidopyrimidine glycosylase [Candidatus Neomarinimicrobiota bacterium]